MVDGRTVYNYDKPNGEFIVDITAADREALIWRADDWSFFDVLSEKMGWDT